MMRAIINRELIVLARRTAFSTAMCGVVSLLAALTLVWSDGVPLLGGANLFAQQQIVLWIVLAAVLPWAAARCVAPDTGNRLVLAAALIAVRPSAIVLGKTAALAGALSLIALSTLPVAILAQQMSAAPALGIIGAAIASAALAVFVAGATIAWLIATRDRVATWVGAFGTTAVMLWLTSGAGQPWLQALFLSVSGLALAAAAARWSDRTYCYLSERYA